MTSAIGGYSRGPSMAQLLYAGPPITPKPTNTTDSVASSPPKKGADVVQISDAAKAALAKPQDDTQAPQPSLKARVDKLFQDARDRGTFITFDSSKGGEWLDVSSFTDDELAQITNDKGAEYPQVLSDYAEGTLNSRLKVTLEPYENSVFDGDRRAHVMTINKLYEQMSLAVRQALGWTPDMIAFGAGMLERDTKIFGPFDENTVISNLLSASNRGGLSFSTTLKQQGQGNILAEV
jgi:hypothetical protein